MPQLAINGGNWVSATEALATAMQEKASLAVIREGIKRSKVFTREEIVEAKGAAGVAIQKKIFTEYPEKYHRDFEWLDTFYKQQVTFLNAKIAGKKIGTTMKYQEYDRDNPNGFMDFITDLVRESYGITQKDTWNPADIWVVDDKRKVRDALIKASQSPNINQLNATLRAMLKQKRVIGISLKKTTKGKPARWEVVNLTATPFSEENDFNFEYAKGRLALGLRPDYKNFTAQDTMIYVNENRQPWVDLQVTATSRRFANLKFEPTQKGASGARLGKAPVDMVKEVLLDFKVGREDVEELMSHNYFPKTVDEFNADKTYYKQTYAHVKRGNLFDMGVMSQDKFTENIITLFEYAEKAGEGTDEWQIRAGRVTSKLMQLHFADILTKVKLRPNGSEQVDQLITSIIFLAMKKGKRFGPFGKLY